MANPLPNPNQYEKGSFETLQASLVKTGEIEKWQRNTDINTFRSAIESEAGFNSIQDKIGNVVNNQARNLKQNKDAKEEASEGQKSFSKDLREGFGRAIKPLFKPLEKLFSNLAGQKFSDFGDFFSAGTERFNAGMKELTNGIGMLGPVINTVKTNFNKLIAFVNVMVGGFQMLGGLLGRVAQSIPAWWSGDEADKKERKRSEKGIQEEIADVERAAAEEGFDISEPEEGEGTGSISGEVSLTPETLDDIRNIVRPYPVEEKGRTGNKETRGGTDTTPKIELPPSLQREDDIANAKKAKSEASFRAQKAKLEEKLAKQVAAKELKAKLAGEKKFRLWQMFLMIAKFLVPIGLLIGTFLFLKSKIDDWSEAPFAGITRAVDDVGIRLKEMMTGIKDKVMGVFSKMRAGLAKIPGIGRFFKETVPDAATSAGGAVDDVAKGGAKEILKKAGSQVVRKIPIAGAIAETAIDATVNNRKFAKIQAAYEAGADIVPVDPSDPGGEKRPMTAEEFEMVQKANAANTAGSVGRGAGAFAGAAAGAAIGSIIPGVGTVIGGVVGGILGGFFGGRAGDDIATNLVAKAQGVESPQELIDMYAANLPDLAEGTGADLSALETDIADAGSEAGDGGAGGNAVAIKDDHSVRTESTFMGPEPITDEALGYSTATP